MTSSDPRWGAELGQETVLGAPCRVFVHRPRHLGDLLLDARDRAASVHLVQADRRLTFGQHEAAVAAVRERLEAAAVRRGDPVLIFGANAIELVVAFWATLRLGAVAVLGNAWWSEAEVRHALATVAPRLVIADERRATRLPGGVERLLYSELRGHVDGAAGGEDRPPVEVAECDPAVVIFTSGTTGFPKGAVLSHRGLIATLQSLLVLTRRLPPQPAAAPSVGLLSLPLFHIGGLAQVITTMVTGGVLVFTEGRFDAAEVVDVMEREGVTVWSTVPTMASRVLDHLEVSSRTLPALRTLGMGGSVVPDDLRRRARRTLPNARRGLGVTYGLTEAGGVVSTGAGDDVALRPGCVGRVLPVHDVRIAEPTPDGSGEILVRSSSIMLGYWSDEGRDGPIDRDRWLHTGDLGRLDDEGFLFVTGRSKDIVIRGGENVACSHVEAAVLRHPAVADVAVLGLPHPDLGEEVGAVVVPRTGDAPDPAELAEFAARSLAHFEVPTAWWIRTDALPYNATGKVVKQTVRADWLARDTVDRPA